VLDSCPSHNSLTWLFLDLLSTCPWPLFKVNCLSKHPAKEPNIPKSEKPKETRLLAMIGLKLSINCYFHMNENIHNIIFPYLRYPARWFAFVQFIELLLLNNIFKKYYISKVMHFFLVLPSACFVAYVWCI